MNKKDQKLGKINMFELLKDLSMQLELARKYQDSLLFHFR